VSRGQGTQLYKITDDQWGRLVEALGGWPEEGGASAEHALEKALASQAQDAQDEAEARALGQGYVSSPERRKAIEDHAMKAAEAYFTERGYEMRDTSANNPYDFVARKDGEILYVEVKGTAGAGKKVILTRGEVEHVREHPGQAALFIRHDIEVQVGEEGQVASGGEHRVIWPWDVDEGTLSPTQYDYVVPEDTGA